MKNLTCIFFTITSLTFFSCNNAHKVNLEAELQALRQADKTWSETATVKDVNGYVEFYDKDAFVIDFNGKITRGMEELRKMVITGFSAPGYYITWHVENAVVSESGDFGYTNGSWDKQVTSENGELIKTHGSYIIIWKKQTNGSWKAIVDGFWKAQ